MSVSCDVLVIWLLVCLAAFALAAGNTTNPDSTLNTEVTDNPPKADSSEMPTKQETAKECAPKPEKAVIGYILPSENPQDPSRQNISSVDGSKLTHLLYAFANVECDGTVFLVNDPDKDAASTASPAKCPKGEEGTPLGGNFLQLFNLKKKFPHLQVLLSIGGWKYSKCFSDGMATPETRSTFVKTTNAIVSKFGFDGIDIDWEFPAVQGKGRTSSPDDYTNLATLLQKFKDSWSSVPGGNCLLLTVCLPALYSDKTTPALADSIGSLSSSADYLLAMTYVYQYDLPFAWYGAATTYYKHDNEAVKILNVNAGYKSYAELNVSANNLVIGIPMYAFGAKLSADKSYMYADERAADAESKENCLYRKTDSLLEDMDYRSLQKILADKSYEVYEDKRRGSASVCDGSTFYSYESVTTAKLKSIYISEKKGVSGIMMWDLSQDLPTTDENSLLSAVGSVLATKPSKMRNSVCIHETNFCNAKCPEGEDPFTWVDFKVQKATDTKDTDAAVPAKKVATKVPNFGLIGSSATNRRASWVTLVAGVPLLLLATA